MTSYLGMKGSFITLGLALLVLSLYLLFKKLIKFRTKDNETQKEIQAHFPIKF